MTAAAPHAGALAVIEQELIDLAQAAAAKGDTARVLALNIARASLAEYLAAGIAIASALRAMPGADNASIARLVERHAEAVAHMLNPTHTPQEKIMATFDIASVLDSAGADSDAPEGSQGWALAQVRNIVATAEISLASLGTELNAIARQHDADEIRRRAGWAASDVDTLRGMFQNAGEPKRAAPVGDEAPAPAPVTPASLH